MFAAALSIKNFRTRLNFHRHGSCPFQTYFTLNSNRAVKTSLIYPATRYFTTYIDIEAEDNKQKPDLKIPIMNNTATSQLSKQRKNNRTNEEQFEEYDSDDGRFIDTIKEI